MSLPVMPLFVKKTFAIPCFIIFLDAICRFVFFCSGKSNHELSGMNCLGYLFNDFLWISPIQVTSIWPFLHASWSPAKCRALSVKFKMVLLNYNSCVT